MVEPEVVGGVAAGPPPCLVEEAVVGVAQEDQVVQVRGPPSAQWTTWWAFSHLRRSHPGNRQAPSRWSEDPVDGLRDLSAPTTDPHRPAPRFQDPLDPGVAGQPADALRGQPVSALGLGQPWAAGGLFPDQRIRAGVNNKGWSTLACRRPGR
jgi:hypothetical protein